MSVDYDQLERAERKPHRVADHSARWAALEPVTTNGQVGELVGHFCERKRISVEALEQLGAKLRVGKSGVVELAFAGRLGDAVTAIKYRPLGGDSHTSRAEQPSTWLRPIVAGNLQSLDWLIAEGETDGARLLGLVGDRVAVLVLPAGALTFRREWAQMIPRGATVGLCHDADEAGDQGAEKAARILGGRTIRLRPPGGDWCDWEGGRDEFLELLGEAAARRVSAEFVPMASFLLHEFPNAEPLLGEEGRILLARGSLFMLYGPDGSGKSTLLIDAIAHLGAGVDWLGFPVPRAVRICVIENEGPPSLFQQKLRAKAESWPHEPFHPNLFVHASPWGAFSFADPDCRSSLADFCEEHEIDLVCANPTLGLGVSASGRPDETQQFVDWLVECGLKTTLAFWLLHHENKAGQISGDWGRHPDTKVSLQRDGNNQRSKLDWAKTRWATLAAEEKTVLLEWVVETQGYTVTQLDTAGASDADLEQRICDYLEDNQPASTNAIHLGVKGTNSRITELLKSGPFDSMKGHRNATLWLLSPTKSMTSSQTPDDEPTN